MLLSFLGLNNVREVVFGVYFGPFTNAFTNKTRNDTNCIRVSFHPHGNRRTVIHEIILAQSKSHRTTVRDGEEPGVSVEKVAIIREHDEEFGEMEECDEEEEGLEMRW